MDGLHFCNFLPNIWVCYIQNNTKPNNCEITLRKFCKIHSIKEVIRLDNDIDYWLKSRFYSTNIRQQIIQNEISKLIKYYKLKNNLIYNNYNNSKGTLIISNKNFEIVSGLLINFLIYDAQMNKQNAYMTLQSIFINPISFSEEMKRLILLYNN